MRAMLLGLCWLFVVPSTGCCHACYPCRYMITRRPIKSSSKAVLKSTLLLHPHDTCDTSIVDSPLWCHSCNTEMIPGTATSTTATQRQENAARGNVITYHCIIGDGHCAQVCIVTKGSTSDSGRDPSFGGSLHTYKQAKTCRLAEHIDRIGTHFGRLTLPQYPPVILHSSSMKGLSDW